MPLSPLAHGFPDWGRQAAASDIQVINSVGLNLTALTDLGIFFVGNLPYMYVRTSSAQSTNLFISWFADAAGTISLTGDTVTTAVGGQAIQCVPVRGPFAKFTMERGAYPGTVTLQVFMTPTIFNAYAGTDGENTLVSVDAFNIGAGGSGTFPASETRGGWVSWNAEVENAATFIARLYADDFAGVAHLIDFVREGARSQSRTVFVPALPLRVFVQNQTAAAHNSFVTVTHHPFRH